MKAVRQALINHLEVVREFTLSIWSVESGIYEMNQLREIFQQPGLIVQMEMDWIKTLHKILAFIQRYLLLVERWANHFLGLATNLGFKEMELEQIATGRRRITDILQYRSFDQDYLHWVLTDVSEEMDRLIAATKHLTSEGSWVAEVAGKFGGPFFNHVEKIALVWTTTARRVFFDPLIDLLQAAHSAVDAEKILQQLCLYLEIILTVATQTPILVDESEAAPYSPKALKSSQDFVNQLVQLTENLGNYLKRRVEAYSLLLQHEEAILRSVLPSGTSVSHWLGNYRTNLSKTAGDFLPKSLKIDILALALKQAADELANWDKAVIDAGNILKKTLILNTLLQSSSVETFLTADQRRLELYREWRPRIGRTFDALLAAVEK